MEAATESKVYRVANMITVKSVQHHICHPDAETEATTRSLVDTEHVTNQLESEIDGITSHEQKRIIMGYSIFIIKSEVGGRKSTFGFFRKPVNNA